MKYQTKSMLYLSDGKVLPLMRGEYLFFSIRLFINLVDFFRKKRLEILTVMRMKYTTTK